MSDLARSIRRSLALAAVTTTSLCAGTAFAATNELEEIVVTAQKQEQKLSETPLSVTALSSTDLKALAATQFRDFANTVPGLGFTANGAGATQINLRGDHLGRKCLADCRHLRGRGPVRIETAFAGAATRAGAGLFDLNAGGSAARTAGHALRREHHGRPAEVRHPTPDLQKFGGKCVRVSPQLRTVISTTTWRPP